jgi:hypothetical protein
MHNGHRVDRLIGALSGLEPDVFGGLDGVFIQAMAEPANDFQDPGFPGRSEQYLWFVPV